MKLLLCLAGAFAARVELKESLGANPIRRVVNMLQAMQKKVEAEGRKEEELFEKFMCYCKNSGKDLANSMQEAEDKINALEADVKRLTATKQQTDEELKQHKADRVEARRSLQTATKMREKEAAQFAKESGDTGANIRALKKAIKAIREGMGGSALLQTADGNVLKNIILNSHVDENDREMLTAFLSQSTSNSSAEIVGILSQMLEEMEGDLKGMVDEENTAIKNFEELSASKNKEIAAATKAIENKTQRSGKLAVEIVEAKDDLEDTKDALSEDQQFVANLKKSCKTKEAEWGERQKIRAEEIQAIAETIKILNDDDALDLFNKTLPKPKQAFIQMDSSMVSLQERAHNIIRQAAATYKNTQLDLISFALKGKKVDFSKVLKMIDDMVVTLGEEQKEDDTHKEYCEKEFDTSEDKQKDTERRIANLEHDKKEAETMSKNLAAEIKALQDGIVALDKSVAEATAQRKSEHADYLESSALDQTAVDLILFAKNRLNKFYNPKLYKPPPKRELTEEERIYTNMGGELEPTPAPGGIAGTGIGAFIQMKKDAPAPPPETFGAYSKKSEESGGVMAMIDMMINDLKKDMQAAKFEEESGQKEYEELMQDSQKKRAADSKSITTKETAKAEADSNAQEAGENLDSSNKQLYEIKQYISELHGSCDFLIENFDFRKNARAEEIDALKKAKAVLNGADYSFLQQTKGFLQ